MMTMRCPGTAAAILLGLLATVGSAAFGIANLQALFDVRAARAGSVEVLTP
jgi:hypothetical protein